MSLIETIKNDSLNARKARNALKSNLLTTLYSEAGIIGKNNGNRESTDEEVIGVVKKFIKNTEILLGLHDSEETKTELTYLKEYLPKQLSNYELKNIISGLIDSGNNIGQVMKHLKENYSGLYDGKVASQLVKG